MIRQYLFTEPSDITGKIAHRLQYSLEKTTRNSLVVSNDSNGLKQQDISATDAAHKKDLMQGAVLGAMSGTVFSLALFCCAILGMVFWTASPALKQAILIGSISLPLLLGTGLGASIGLMRKNRKVNH